MQKCLKLLFIYFKKYSQTPIITNQHPDFDLALPSVQVFNDQSDSSLQLVFRNLKLTLISVIFVQIMPKGTQMKLKKYHRSHSCISVTEIGILRSKASKSRVKFWSKIVKFDI